MKVIVLVMLTTLIPFGLLSASVMADSTYGSGDYGSCEYSSCSISISSNSTVSLDVTPSVAGACTVQSDTVSVLTDNTTGYNLTLTTATTSNSLEHLADTVSASGGTTASPIVLATNSWGFRLDGLSGFGAGPTVAQSSASAPGLSFAGVPASNQPPATLASTAGPANPAVTSIIWYGLCLDTSLPSGTYTTSVTYTALTN